MMIGFFILAPPLLLALLSFLSSAANAAVVPQTNPLQGRANDCTNLDADFDETCWEILGVTDFLSKWQPPQCSANKGTANCCVSGVEWSTCFLKLHVGPYNCTTISTDVCAFDPSVSEVVDPAIKPQVRYVLKNIFYVHALFNNWDTATGQAISSASLVVDEIIQEIDPIKKTNVLLTAILTALTAGLAFVPGFGAASQGAKLAANGLVTALQQAPGVAQAIWPKGTANSQMVQLAELKNELEDASELIQAQLNLGLNVLMRDKASFASFVQSGWLSGTKAPSIPDDRTTLLVGLKTFVLTTALTANGWYGKGRALNNPEPTCAPQTNEAQTRCWNDFGIHNANASWVLWNDEESNERRGQVPLNVVTKHWSHHGYLFDGALGCAARGGSGSKDYISIGEDGNLDLNCLNQLKVCEEGLPLGTKDGCYTNLVDGKCPVSTCGK